MHTIHVIDSHTGGEPTRVVLSGVPEGELETYRRAIICEPRGHDVIVGALLSEPRRPDCVAAVTFFNNVGLLGMCGHGMIGLVVTLAHLGRIGAGSHRIETPVGVVTATLHEDGSVSVANVASFRQTKAVTLDVAGLGPVTGDVAWGGNWFFLTETHGQPLETARVAELTAVSLRIREAANAQGFPEIDHVELFGPPRNPEARSRSFVLCPGGAYDRSPCGTGTSAKLACLAADGKLAEGETWIQESIIGSTFSGTFTWEDRAAGRILPVIRGTAFVTAEITLRLDERDPFRLGI